MAFPVPEHLPRGGAAQDVSTEILTKVSEATPKTLTAQLASSWIAELDRTILQTKERIHDRIYAELPSFDRQLETSKSVQQRLRNLSDNVRRLSDSLSHPQNGLLPNLVRSLTEHSALAQQAADSDVSLNALSHLSECNTELQSLSGMVVEGKLTDAAMCCSSLQELLDHAPQPLLKADITVDLKKRFRALRDTVEEQLSDAYSRSIHVSASEFVICPSVQVRQSSTIIPLSGILNSLTKSSLGAHLSSLRRDLIIHFIESPLQQPMSLTVSDAKDDLGAPSHVLSLFPTPNNPTPPFKYLQAFYDFLSLHLFPILPVSDRDDLSQALFNSTTGAILQLLLRPSIPSSLATLPPFLELVKQATQFEKESMTNLPGISKAGEEVKYWAENVGNHYARKRRVDLLDFARALVLPKHKEGDESIFRVEVPRENAQTQGLEAIPASGSDDEHGDDAWSLGDDTFVESTETHVGSAARGDHNQENGVEQPSKPDEKATDIEDDPEDAWGWGDADVEDDNVSSTDASFVDANSQAEDVDESPWDEPWGDEPEDRPPTPPPAPVPAKQPKLAKGLEKLAAKGQRLSGSSAPSSPLIDKGLSAPHATSTVTRNSSKPTPEPSPKVIQKARGPEIETFAVSGRAKDIMNLVEEILAEGEQLSLSSVLEEFPGSASSSPATLISQTAPNVLDIWRALRPIAIPSTSTRLPELSMRFSSDCLYLSKEVSAKTVKLPDVPVTKPLEECAERLVSLGEWWFDSAIEKQQQSVFAVLERAKGFVDCSEPEQFDECEMTISTVLRQIMSIGQQWKSVLARTRYYRAIGFVVDAALSTIVEDVLKLPDITEVESSKLCELCRMLNALESLFIESVDEPSLVVVYVPSWLKYSYLSELLEASMADISYLFDEGALIDFKVEELARLIKALFSDTPLRANTIARVMRGHPLPQ
ncbi:hypothetical protein BD410DRAFT_768181 [Rickenella mellea]|uniref:ZW10 C-terminal helical domain-containing protein n=1 Tax=Rickenella mellea TaxID=50990 RepID=A0A4Y7Q8L4_9AGAM|nr:hypothetical protein BD410DRAFT_768181 [Rickenella mellea]